MTIQDLQQRLNNAQKEVEKRLGTIKKLCAKLNINYQELIDKYYNLKPEEYDYTGYRELKSIVDSFVQEKDTRDENGWNDESYEFNSKISQLKDNLPKLFDIERVANDWQIKLDKEINKQKIEKIPAIWNFLTDWENKSIEWYKKNAELYFNLRKENDTKLREYKNSKEFEEKVEINLRCYRPEYLEKNRKYLENRVRYNLEEKFIKNYYSQIDSFTKVITYIKSHYNYEESKYEYINYTINEELLTKTIAKEKEDKYFDLVKRVTSLVGEIIDASNLSIGNQRGELNGIIIGEKGNVRVETISAGGYNIQRFHYRVLLKEVK